MYNSKNKQLELIQANEIEVENTIIVYYLNENKRLVEELINNGYEMHNITSITSNLTVENAYEVLGSLVERLNVTQ